MKRTIAFMTALIALAAVAALALTGCAKGANDPLKDEPLTDILDSMYAASGLELPNLATTDIDATNIEYYLGVTDLDYKEAIGSEPLMSSIAYSVCLVRMNEGADIEAAKTAIKTSVDPVKWVCVSVEDKDVVVDSIGNVIVLIMTENSAALHDAFLSLADK